MMFKLLLLLPIILGPKCLVYSNENNDTSVKLTVDTQPTTISVLTQTPSNLAADGAGQPAEEGGESAKFPMGNLYPDDAEETIGEPVSQTTPENSVEQTGAETTEVDAEQVPEGTTQPDDEGDQTVVVEESEKPAEEAAPESPDQGSGSSAFKVVVVGSDDSAEASSEVVRESAGETVVQESDGTVVDEQANEMAVVTTETPADQTAHDQTAGEAVVSEDVVQVAEEENVSAETTELVAEEAVVPEPVLPEPVPEPVLPEVNGLKLVDLDIVNFENNTHVNHRFDRKLNMHMFSVKSGHAFGYVKESFSKHELENLAKDDLYKSLTQLKNNNLFHLHSDNIVNGAYRWKDTFVLLEHLKNGTLESKLQEETLFVTVEVDKMEASRHFNYGFVDNLHVFAPNSPFIIDSVKLDGEFVWVYDDDRNDKKFPVSVEFNGSDMIKLKFDKFYFTYTRNGSKKWNVQFDFYEQLSIEAPKEVEHVPATEVVAVKENEGEQEQPKEEVSTEASPASEDQGESAPLVEGDQQQDSESDQHMPAEEAPKGEAEESESVPEAEVETVAVPESEPESLLDDHLVSAFEFVWRQNVAALEVPKPVYANHVYVRTKDNEKTVTIFFTDRSYIRLHRIGQLGPWRERVVRPRTITLPPYPRIKYKPLELWTFPEPRQYVDYEFTKEVALSDLSSQKPTDRRDAKRYGRDFLALMYSHNTTPARRQGEQANEGSTRVSGGSGSTDQDAYGSGYSSRGMTSGGSSGGDQDGSKVVTTPDPNQSSTATPASETYTAPSAEPAEVAKEAVTLDIKNAKESTSQFDYKKEGKIVTFTAKDGFGFSSVKTKSGGSCCSKKDVKIWDAKDPKEYASKVVLEGKGNKKKTVTIHFFNGSKKVFKKDNKKWNELSQS